MVVWVRNVPRSGARLEPRSVALGARACRLVPESSCELGLEWDLWGGPVGLTVAALQSGRCHGGDVVFVCVSNVLRSGAGGEARTVALGHGGLCQSHPASWVTSGTSGAGRLASRWLRSNLDAATAETWCLCALETYSEAAPAGRRTVALGHGGLCQSHPTSWVSRCLAYVQVLP